MSHEPAAADDEADAGTGLGDDLPGPGDDPRLERNRPRGNGTVDRNEVSSGAERRHRRVPRRLRGAAGNAVHRARGRWAAAAAVRQARRLRRAQPDATLVCWDLDNTLVDSGSLLRLGRRLPEAIVEGEPVPNMLAFYAALGDGLSGAGHVILSARTPAMRADTLTWLSRHGLAPADGALWFVPHAAAKVRVWQTLAKAAPLVIVDDLTYDHEAEIPSLYHDLVATARRTAAVYIGVDEIAMIARDPDAVAGIVAETVAAVRR